MLVRFVLYGIAGWCAEIVWTAVYDLVEALAARRPVDPALAGRTYLWMFPIYGGGGLLFEHAHAAVAGVAWPLRGLVYMLGCFVVEYGAGALIRAVTGKIPWDYTGRRWHVHGLIRLDYAPVWFGFGLLLEQIERIVRAIAPVVTQA